MNELLALVIVKTIGDHNISGFACIKPNKCWEESYVYIYSAFQIKFRFPKEQDSYLNELFLTQSVKNILPVSHQWSSKSYLMALC